MTVHRDENRMNELISGYLTGELSSEELKELKNWLIASEENKSYFIRKQELWFSAIGAEKTMRFDKEKAFERFLARTSIAGKKPISRKRFALSFTQAAAAVVAVIIIGSISYLIGTGTISNRDPEHVLVEAPFGSKSKIYLPDGTLVWLNAGSTISYSGNFGGKERVVKLSGEGYFEVMKDAGKPFYVKTNDITVRVLGTKFNFRNYLDEDEARVTLLEGKVLVGTDIRNESGITLTPNEQITIDKATLQARVSKTKASNSAEWTHGLIFFDEEKLSDIVRELERSYNVQITIADDSLLSYRFYGNFIRTEQTIQEVLDVLASTDKLQYEINGKNVTLKLKE